MSFRQSMGFPPVVALHRYWMHANLMRIHFEEELKKKPPNTTEKDPAKIVIESVRYLSDERGMFMSYWYGSLYVVIEGWRQLRLTDSKIDPLISSPNVGLLKKYRDGVFHFQRNYFDDRFTGFVSYQDSVTWVRAIHSEFGRYFLQEAEARNKSNTSS
jgi:hypothetical protein